MLLKRAFDVALAGTALVLLSPLLMPIGMLLLLTGEREIFYRQERIGRGGKRFQIYKFATMLKDSPNLAGGDITVGMDPRILPFGQFLRKTKINELPQLLNVIVGDMSIIGPRPLTPRVAALFPAQHWDTIAALRPGLSGVASIVFRNEEALLVSAENRERVYADHIVPYKMALEQWYLRNQTISLDLKLVGLTAIAVLNRKFDVSRVLSNLPPPQSNFIALIQAEKNCTPREKKGGS
jgi:lipopolysaccharide/colanic/teichoic acid biosynthesis glycosyltransferase